jgi:hypothetical protein
MAGTRSVLTRTLLVTLAALAVAAPSLGAEPIKDPHGIACPPGPSGWFNPPGDSTSTSSGGRMIIAPGSIAEVGGPMQGGNTVNVTCDYFTEAGKHLTIDLLYALPTDPNPINDFYFGCGTGGTRWTDDDRTFRIQATNQWASVAFFDFLGQLAAGDVPGFQNVARQLLRNSAGYAHACDLKVEPTPTMSRFQFSFESSAGKAEGLFFTAGEEEKMRQPILVVGVPTIKLNVRSGAARRPLALEVRRGLMFQRGEGKNRQVQFSVVVANSKVPACSKGSTGTLTITAKPSVLLKVCSKSFLQGPAKASIITN